MQSKLLEACLLCGHRCGVNRVKGERGKCQGGIEPLIVSHCLHHGEEPMISGTRGSGTIFFANCCLKCVYCQNWEISQRRISGDQDISRQGIRESGDQGLVEIMLELQGLGAHNINLVSPTHYGIQIKEAIVQAKQQGLKLPIVYNSGGYDSLELLREFEGLIDIYLPDFKYFDDEKAIKYSGAENYVETAKTGIAEMFRQVGEKLLVRHLVLPNNLSNSRQVLEWLAGLSKNIWISLMSQYSPQYRAGNYPELNRRLRADEYNELVDYAESLGLDNVYVQETDSSKVFLPNFKKENPFNR